MNQELSIKLGAPPADSVRGEVDEAPSLGAVGASAQWRAPTRTALRPPAGNVRPIGAARLRGEIVLGPAQFSRQLECEKRRGDRSGMPLSLVLFRIPEGTGDWRARDQLIHLVCADKRQTDFVGCLEDGLVAVLLPDTNERGSQRFVDKIKGSVASTGFSATTGTYPDDLFESLRSEHGAPAAINSLAVEREGLRSCGREFVKRAVDLLGAGVGLIALAPVMAVVAMTIAMTSPGPVLYTQTRLGRGGRPFAFHKFRSMYRDADERVHREYVTALIAGAPSDTASGQRPWAKLESDPRITPVGRFLRKTCLDELPQLLNVLKGDLSLVGPRPPLPYEAAAYRSWHLRRVLDVKPGITGLWQVEGRNLATFDDMVRIDLRYVSTWSLALDIRILLKTLVLVVSKRGGG